MSVAIPMTIAAREDGLVLDRLEVQLLVHHRRQPRLAVGGDRGHDILEQRAREALGGVDVADLLALRFWRRGDLG